MIDENIIKKEFDKYVKLGRNNMIVNLGELLNVQFNYFANGKKSIIDSNYLGSDFRSLSKFEDGEYNGSANYIPDLIIIDNDKTIKYLTILVNTILTTYDFNRLITKYGIEDVLKRIFIIIFSNATYYDYENVLDFLKRNINFYKNANIEKCKNTIISNYITSINGKISVSNYLDAFGYETPFRFDIMITNDEYIYNLPTINYGISNNTCYIYSVQNKEKNDINACTKTIKRKLNKINANVIENTDLESKDTILGTTPSFILSLTIFCKYLKSHNINDIEFITFMPDRYFDKEYTKYDKDNIQKNITEKNILSFHRLKYHFPNIDINYPIYDGYSFDGLNHGNNLLINISNMDDTSNNPFMNEILDNLRIDIKKKTI